MSEKYKNDFEKEVLKNSIFVNKMLEAFKKIKKEDFFLREVDGKKGYLLEDIEEKTSYLIMEDETKTIVYREEKRDDKKHFENFQQNEIKNLQYYATEILTLFNSKEVEEKIKKDQEKEISMLQNKYKFFKDEPGYLQVLEGMKKKIQNTQKQNITSNPYELKMFLNLLEKKGLSSEFNKDFLRKNPDLYQQIEEQLPEFGIIFETMIEGLKKHSITEKNKFNYNDLDNDVWINSSYICAKEQNFYWVIDFKNRKNFIAYAALNPSNGKGSKAQSMPKLLKKVKSKESIDEIDYVGLKVENGKVIYANNSFINNLSWNILFNKDALEEAGIIQMDYDGVDVNSFDYQFAYANKKYKMNRLDFLHQALLVLGNGYQYNEDSGRIYTNVEFIPGLLENFEPKEEKDNKIESLIFLYPPKLKYLDDKWLKNLEWFVEKIKKDKPNLEKVHTRDSKKPQEIIKELEQAIKWNHNFRKNKLKA